MAPDKEVCAEVFQKLRQRLKRTNKFLPWLFELLFLKDDKDEGEQCWEWTDDGSQIYIPDMDKFQQRILPSSPVAKSLMFRNMMRQYEFESTYCSSLSDTRYWFKHPLCNRNDPSKFLGISSREKRANKGKGKSKAVSTNDEDEQEQTGPGMMVEVKPSPVMTESSPHQPHPQGSMVMMVPILLPMMQYIRPALPAYSPSIQFQVHSPSIYPSSLIQQQPPPTGTTNFRSPVMQNPLPLPRLSPRLNPAASQARPSSPIDDSIAATRLNYIAYRNSQVQAQTQTQTQDRNQDQTEAQDQNTA